MYVTAMPNGQMEQRSMEQHSMEQHSTEQHTTVAEETNRPNLQEMPSVEAGPLSADATTVSDLQAAAWSAWTLRPSTAIYAPAVTSRGENLLDLFAIGTDSQVYHQTWDGSRWSLWDCLGGTSISAPAVVSRGPNLLDLFVIGIDKQIYHKSWTGEAWSAWQSLGGTGIHGVAATSWGAGRIDLFTVGTNSSLYHKFWDGRTWSSWQLVKLKGYNLLEKCSTVIAAPAAVSSQPNRIDLFALGIDNNIYHAWGDGTAEWMGWENLGGPCIDGVAASSRGANRIDVFSIGTDTARTDNHLYYRSWNGSSWSRWESLGGACVSAPAVASCSGDRVDAFVIGTRSALYQKTWSSTGGIATQGEDTKYDKAQYIGYVIPTSTLIAEAFPAPVATPTTTPTPTTTTDEEDEEDEDEVEVEDEDETTTITTAGLTIKQRYKGSLSIEEDWKSRVAFMQAAIDKAHSTASSDSSTLKVFVAPEFFFRGSSGAYPLSTLHDIVSALTKMVNDPKWKDWMFVFGSIVGYFETPYTDYLKERFAEGEVKRIVDRIMQKLNRQVDTRFPSLSVAEREEKVDQLFDELVVYSIVNTVLVQQGAKGEDGARVVVKEYISNIDFPVRRRKEGLFSNARTGQLEEWKLQTFAQEEVVPLVSGKLRQSGLKPNRGKGQETQKQPFDGLGIFQMNNITFGLEVCLDHAERRLAQSPLSAKQQPVQIQLIPSAGMTIHEDAVVATTGGQVFNCDGSGRRGHSQLAVVDEAADSLSYATLDYVNNPTVLKLSNIPGVSKPDTFFEQLGSLHLYAPLSIPAAKVS